MESGNQMMEKFGEKHQNHASLHGDENEERLTGSHETSPIIKLLFCGGNRAASIRVQTSTALEDGKGYAEDRIPALDIDPYSVSATHGDEGGESEDLAGSSNHLDEGNPVLKKSQMSIDKIGDRNLQDQPSLAQLQHTYYTFK